MTLADKFPYADMFLAMMKKARDKKENLVVSNQLLNDTLEELGL